MSIFKQNKSRGKKSAQGALKNLNDTLLSEKSDFFVREAYKTMRTNIIFSLTGNEECKVLILTSAMQGEGKSTASSNVAISFAQDGKRVLLVECDLRRPKLKQLFRMSSKKGLSDLLIDSSCMREVILSTTYQNLDLVLCGAIPPNPSELLGSDSMKTFINCMKSEYDIIILDTPPLTMVTDALVLVPSSDGVLMVTRAEYSEPNAIAFALDQLARARAKVLGFILNAISFEKTAYGYGGKKYNKYSYYGRRRGYGYGKNVGYSYMNTVLPQQPPKDNN